MLNTQEYGRYCTVQSAEGRGHQGRQVYSPHTRGGVAVLAALLLYCMPII
jgi:hypothetical protein